MTSLFAADVSFSHIFNLQSEILQFSAKPAFLRGSGFYFSPFKLAAIIIVYLIWVVRTTWWVDHDCRDLELPTIRWNPIMLATGLFGAAPRLPPCPCSSLPSSLCSASSSGRTLRYVGIPQQPALATSRKSSLLGTSEKSASLHCSASAKRMSMRGRSSSPSASSASRSTARTRTPPRVRRAAESQHYRSLEVGL